MTIMPGFTSDNITSLREGEIFVFGSNIQGIHGAGAARTAMKLFGARPGDGIGYTGQCYAIPTRSYKGGKFKTLSLENINYYVDTFLVESRILPFKTYLVTRLGCGHAGYTPEDIAPMFQGYPANVILPKEFYNVLNYDILST